MSLFIQGGPLSELLSRGPLLLLDQDFALLSGISRYWPS